MTIRSGYVSKGGREPSPSRIFFSLPLPGRHQATKPAVTLAVERRIVLLNDDGCKNLPAPLAPGRPRGATGSATKVNNQVIHLVARPNAVCNPKLPSRDDLTC